MTKRAKIQCAAFATPVKHDNGSIMLSGQCSGKGGVMIGITRPLNILYVTIKDVHLVKIIRNVTTVSLSGPYLVIKRSGGWLSKDQPFDL